MRNHLLPVSASHFALLFVAAIAPGPALAEGPGYMLQLQLKGQTLEGTPLNWSKDQVVLLGRDGRLWDFDPRAARDFQKTNPNFVGYTAAELRAQLTRELGPSFEITGTGHYLVAHPRGQGEQWSQRFEDLYRSFVHYFSVRGMKLQEPKYPLVAIVWPKQEDFMRYAAAEGAKIDRNVLGYYSPASNRITLFDATATSGASWEMNADTIIHEATHQTAFNTGVHSRFAQTPRWVAEGLGTLFEARGVWNSRQYKDPQDRINRGRLADFKLLISKRKEGSLVEFLSSDKLFDRNPEAAYAEAWALTHFLVEQYPRQYTAYLKRVASRKPFTEYAAAERLADFTAEFGTNLRLIEARFLRYMAEEK